jgi:hypothetical protein
VVGVDLKRVVAISVVAYAHLVVVYNLVGFVLCPLLGVGAQGARLLALVGAIVFVLLLHVSNGREGAEEVRHG